MVTGMDSCGDGWQRGLVQPGTDGNGEAQPGTEDNEEWHDWELMVIRGLMQPRTEDNQGIGAAVDRWY